MQGRQHVIYARVPPGSAFGGHKMAHFELCWAGRRTCATPEDLQFIGEGPGEVPQYGDTNGVLVFRNLHLRIRRRPCAR